jgi:hypothetical protein
MWNSRRNGSRKSDSGGTCNAHGYFAQLNASMKQQHDILIGSDEPVIADAIRILLTRMAQDGREFQFTSSSHCSEFIEQAHSGHFDLAIMHANCLVPTRPFTLQSTHYSQSGASSR